MVEYTIESSELTRKFRDLLAVDHVNFKMEEGELWGLLGPNGAGKTTTVPMLCCLLTSNKGTAKVAGHDVQKGMWVKHAHNRRNPDVLKD